MFIIGTVVRFDFLPLGVECAEFGGQLRLSWLRRPSDFEVVRLQQLFSQILGLVLRSHCMPLVYPFFGAHWGETSGVCRGCWQILPVAHECLRC